MSAAMDLRGLLVVALEQAVAAPYCTSRLADAGARVIKVERAEGDFARRYDGDVLGQSAYFVWLNRGKESICLDIKDAADRLLLTALLARADVFVQNLAPGAAARAGFDDATLRANNPRLITCSISGYGDDGPYAAMKAYDLLVQAESGLAFLSGTTEGPGRVGVSVCDIGAGMNAHAAILQALYQRERTGRGRALAVSLFDAMADWMNVPYLQTRYGKREVPRLGLAHPTIAPYGAYPARDGVAVLISIQNEREWIALCAQILGDTRLASDARFATNSQRVEHRDELDQIIRAAFAVDASDRLAERLFTAGVAFGLVNDVEGLARHPQLRRRRVPTPAGDVEIIAPAPRADGPADGDPLRAVPALGEHTDRIRREFETRPAAAAGDRSSG